MPERPAVPIELALDQNFPEPILRALDEFVTDVRLIPLRQVDPRLTDLDDRSLLIALQQRGFPGLVTNNYKMLSNPKELAAVLKTHLAVFAIEGVGHDPIRATGALLLDLPGAVRRLRQRGGRVFWLRPRNPQPQDAWELFERAAQRLHADPAALYDEVKVTDEELSTSVL